MATILDFVLMAVVFAGNTFIAAVMTRFFRLQLETRWGAVVYTGLLVPVALVVTTIVAFSVGVGVDLGSAAAVLGLMIGLPMGLGVTIDVLYIPAPDEYELPETTGR
jgi:ABC-type molybdate transport system permease subunit